MRDIDKDTLRQAAKVAEEQTNKVVAESVERIRQRNREERGCPNCAAPECYPSCPRYLTHSEGGVFWEWWLRTSPHRSGEIEPRWGPPKKKGGRKSGRKRKKPPKIYKNPYLEV